MHEAHAAGTQISFDLNYRAKLWTWDECRPIMDELASQAHLVIGATRDAQSLISDILEGETLVHALHQRWSGPTVILTKGSEGTYAYDGDNFHDVPAYTEVQIVDRIGAGDAFAAGLLCALLDGKSLPESIHYGNTVAALKMTVPGDIALINRQEVEALLTDSSTDVQR
jgi:2-dehydro-3-deoxygluconokinase